MNSACPLTVPDLLHDELVEVDLVDALVQAVGLVDVLHLRVQTLQLGVAQLWTQDPVVELLWRRPRTWSVQHCNASEVLSMMGVLTHGQAELQHMHGSFLLQEVHEAKEEVLLASDLLQLQLQHLRN